MYSSLKKVLILVAVSCGLTVYLFIFFQNQLNKAKLEKVQDSQYLIQSIIQTGPEKEVLQTAYLAELLDLSCDEPTNLYAFDIQEGQKKLTSSPVIASAKIKREPPGTLYIDYEVRKPVALLGDFANAAIDKDGYLFPVVPFFSPKELPEIYLGLSSNVEENLEESQQQEIAWGKQIESKDLSLAFEVLRFLEEFSRKEGIRIKKIDVSSAFAMSLGQREIVLMTEEELVSDYNGNAVCCVFPKMLRLSPKDYSQQMLNFLSLRKKIMDDYDKQIGGALIPDSGRFSSRIIDLRIPHLAFVEN